MTLILSKTLNQTLSLPLPLILTDHNPDTDLEPNPDPNPILTSILATLVQGTSGTLAAGRDAILSLRRG
jgi:hypothetical protein